MSSSTAGTDRARALQKQSSSAASVAVACGVIAALCWLTVIIGWSGTQPGEHVSGVVIAMAALGTAMTAVMAAFAGASYVLGALSEVEPIR